jgi:hypothetical protein
MHTLTTLYRLRVHLGLQAAETSDDPRLIAALITATAQIESEAGRSFIPRLATLICTLAHADDLFSLPDDLLELQAISDDTGAIPLDEIERLPAEGVTTMLRRKDSAAFTGDVSITGIWGWHDRPQHAWLKANDAPTAAVAISDTTFTVTNASGADSWERTPRLQVGALIRLDSEYLRVTAITANMITVLRGVNGTTPAAHAASTPIWLFEPPAALAELCLRWAAWLIQHPTAPIPSEFHAALAGYRRLVVA